MVARQADRDWARRYALRLLITDLLVIVWAVVAAQLLRFGLSADEAATLSRGINLNLSYTTISIVLILAWMLVLAVFRSRDARVVGAGSTEYRLVIQATLWLFGLSAIVLFLFKIDIARAYVLIALPLGLLVLVFSRWLWRQWLNAKRRSGRYSYRVLIVGTLESVTLVARDLHRSTFSGYHVVGAVVPGASSAAGVLHSTTIPVRPDVDGILPFMTEIGADTLVIANTDRLAPDRVRELSWGLDPGRQHLVMAPNLTDVGGPRIHMRPVAGLPLMHVETPRFVGPQLFLKRAFDLLGSGILIVLLSPLLITVTIIVRVSTPGPVLFRQERIGHQGRPFRMVRAASDLGLPVTVFLMPVLPYLTDTREHLERAARLVREAGAARAIYTALHLRPGVREWFLAWLAREHPELVAKYGVVYSGGAYAQKDYREWLRRKVRPILQAHGLA